LGQGISRRSRIPMTTTNNSTPSTKAMAAS
jgi:hypothetical protein